MVDEVEAENVAVEWSSHGRRKTEEGRRSLDCCAKCHNPYSPEGVCSTLHYVLSAHICDVSDSGGKRGWLLWGISSLVLFLSMVVVGAYQTQRDREVGVSAAVWTYLAAFFVGPVCGSVLWTWLRWQVHVDSAEEDGEDEGPPVGLLIRPVCCVGLFSLQTYILLVASAFGLAMHHSADVLEFAPEPILGLSHKHGFHWSSKKVNATPFVAIQNGSLYRPYRGGFWGNELYAGGENMPPAWHGKNMTGFFYIPLPGLDDIQPYKLYVRALPIEAGEALDVPAPSQNVAESKEHHIAGWALFTVIAESEQAAQSDLPTSVHRSCVKRDHHVVHKHRTLCCVPFEWYRQHLQVSAFSSTTRGEQQRDFQKAAAKAISRAREGVEAATGGAHLRINNDSSTYVFMCDSRKIEFAATLELYALYLGTKPVILVMSFLGIPWAVVPVLAITVLSCIALLVDCCACGSYGCRLLAESCSPCCVSPTKGSWKKRRAAASTKSALAPLLPDPDTPKKLDPSQPSNISLEGGVHASDEDDLAVDASGASRLHPYDSHHRHRDTVDDEEGDDGDEEEEEEENDDERDARRRHASVRTFSLHEPLEPITPKGQVERAQLPILSVPNYFEILEREAARQGYREG